MPLFYIMPMPVDLDLYLVVGSVVVGATNQRHNILNQQLLHQQQKKQLTLLDLEGMLRR
jgi:hypothetical protein